MGYNEPMQLTPQTIESELESVIIRLWDELEASGTPNLEATIRRLCETTVTTVSRLGVE